MNLHTIKKQINKLTDQKIDTISRDDWNMLICIGLCIYICIYRHMYTHTYVCIYPYIQIDRYMYTYIVNLGP